jgi:ActR/RegA family two-component response regulator
VPGPILIVDDDVDVLDSLADVARVMFGFECLTARSYEDLVALGDRVHACRVAVLDINLGAGRRTGVEAYNWLRQSSFAGKVFFLTGHARNHPLVEEARNLGNVEIIEKPANIQTLRAAFTV